MKHHRAIVFLGLILILASLVLAIIVPAGAWDNLLENPDFEEGVTGWSAYGGTLSQTESPVHGGAFAAAFKSIVFKRRANNVIDAAIALSNVESLGNATPGDGYGIPKSATEVAYINMLVMKYGRTTGFTHGQVYAIDATINVRYGSGFARFVHQIVITPGAFSAGGDSGSLIVVDGGDDTQKPVGLLFAGSSSYTIANPIDDVLVYFGVTIDGQ